LSNRAAASCRGVITLVCWLCAAASARAAVPAPVGVEISPPVRQTLQQLQEEWLQWMSAYNQQRAESIVNDLVTTAHQLGMSRLPDLAYGALARSVQAAKQGEAPRAEWGLAAAERLDPGRPETSFAEATVARYEGQYVRMVAAWFSGFWRQFALPMERDLLIQSLLLWSLKIVLVTGGLFVGALMATRGAGLWHDLVSLGERYMPRPAALAVVALLLVWPLLLPAGLLWLALFWSLLLWGHSSRSERTVVIVLWLILGLSPLALAQQRRHLSLLLSPPMQAVASLEQHRLYGDLFTDLGVLTAMLPESTAVKHLLADVHTSLNQWDLARSLYRQVLDEEPRNSSALINLGAYAFYKGDWHSAIESFQEAVSADPRSATALFDLSQAYSRSYMFDDQKRALEQAKEVDSDRVDQWLRRADQEHVIVTTAGLARIPEIRRSLVTAWRIQDASRWQTELGRYGLPFLISLGIILVAMTLHLLRRPFGYATPELRWRLGRSRWWSFPRVLLPGLSSAAAGEGVRAFGALLLPIALATLPWLDRLGYRVPWGYDPGSAVCWIISLLGLALYLAARFSWELRNTV
jgi:tetratricopeptide (TPR) repeat protein